MIVYTCLHYIIVKMFIYLPAIESINDSVEKKLKIFIQLKNYTAKTYIGTVQNYSRRTVHNEDKFGNEKIIWNLSNQS
jgi:hypothetical protein